MLARLRSISNMIFRRSRWERDLRDEIQFHIEERADHLASTGVPRAEALRRARLEFGGVEAFKEECREARAARWIDECSRNSILAVRSIRKNPGFTAVAVLSLALGIGANLAVFSVLQRLVLTTLSVREPQELYELVVVSASGTFRGIPYPKFEVIHDNFDIFKPLFGWGSFGKYPVSVGEWTDRIKVTAVTGNFFDALGLGAVQGRLLTATDDQGGDVAVISHDLWQSAFAGDPGIVGRSLKVADAAFVVVGVAPREFGGPEPGSPTGVYLPLPAFEHLQDGVRKRAGQQWFHVMGRLPAAIPVETARAQLRDRWPQIDEPNRKRFTRNTHDTIILENASHGFSAARLEFSSALMVVMGLVAAVFLIACANLATLLFVRGAGREREMNVRFALGANRGQLIRQWLTECMVLSILGGVAGLVFARWITDLLLLFVAEADRPWLRFQTDPAALWLGVALTLAAGLLCGLLPGLRATRAKPETMLRPSAGPSTRLGPLAQWVLAGQLAASLVLVVGGVLFARTLWNLNSATGGFDRNAVIYAIPDFMTSDIPRDKWAATVESVRDRLAESPLVDAISVGSPPMVWGDSGWGWITGVTGYTLSPEENNTAWANSSLPGFFNVLKIPLVAGRDFEERDRPEPGKRSTVIIVNEKLARHYFGDRNPVGERLIFITPMEIIGVAKDTQNKSLRDPRKDVVYMPIGLGAWSAILARPRPGVSTDDLAREVRSAFESKSERISVKIEPLEDAVQASLGRDRLVARLSAVFAALGILLAFIGLYAAVAHSVFSRTREIGIRIAVGASARDVTWMVLKQSLRVTTIGVLIGLPAATAASRLIGSLLFEVSPSDPLMLGLSTTILAATGLVAGWWPARQAARLDPSTALRFE